MSKHKGPSQKQPYAARLMAAKAVVSDRQRQQIVHNCLYTIYYAAAIALNEEFGFGSDRVKRFGGKLDETLLEFGALQDGADTDYAVTALKRRYEQIVKDKEVGQ